jgi:DHA3 family macrolide efflux protein-like MFS transporter
MSKNTTRAAEQGQAQSMAPFFIIWAGQAFSLLGSGLVQFAVVWWLTKMTGSATVLAFATLMSLLPQVFLSPFAGALIDRWDRRTVLIVADGVIAVATVMLALAYARGAEQIWHIYALVLIRAIGGAFHWPAMQASTTLLVPEEHLSRVAGLNQTLYGVTNIVSPPLGALLLDWLPMQGILAIDVGTAMLAIAALSVTHIPQPKRREASKADDSAPSVLADLREGVRFVWGWPGLRMIVVVAMLINLLVNPAFSLLPIMVTRHFGGGALELAWLQSGWGIGMVAGGVALGLWGGFRRRAFTALLALALQGVGITVVGLAPASAFLLALGALFFAGFMNPIINGSVFAILQAVVPADMQGRVFTLALSGAAAMSPLGMVIAGPVADALGVQVWFLIGGVATLAMGAGCFFAPAITHIEDKVVVNATGDEEAERRVR